MSLTILDQNDKKELEKKIDGVKSDTKKQIDEAIANATGPIDPSRIKDMYYDNGFVAVAELLAETTIALDPNNVSDNDYHIKDFALSFEMGKKYLVNWRGTEYVTSVVDLPSIFGEGTSGIGNFGRAMINAGQPGIDTGEPFFIYCAINGSYRHTNLMPLDGREDDLVVSIYEAVEDFRQIPPKYIKDMYYDEGGEVVEIFPETTVPFTDGQVPLPVDLGLTVGETYIVKWNGAEYNCIAQECMLDGTLVGVYIGNQSAVGGADTGEPFLVLDATPDMAAAEGAEGMAFALDGSESVTASIVQNKAKIHKIPNKYLDLEWIPETVKADKTLYEYSTHFSGFPAETLSEKPFEIVEGKKYTVVWNDVEYVCIGHEVDFGAYRVAYIGTTKNGMWVSTIPDAVNTDVPFGFEWVDDGPGTPILTGDDGSMGYIRSIEKNIDVTVKVISSVETVEKLPEKFLPMDDIIQAVKDSIPTWEGGSY